METATNRALPARASILKGTLNALREGFLLCSEIIRKRAEKGLL